MSWGINKIKCADYFRLRNYFRERDHRLHYSENQLLIWLIKNLVSSLCGDIIEPGIQWCLKIGTVEISFDLFRNFFMISTERAWILVRKSSIGTVWNCHSKWLSFIKRSSKNSFEIRKLSSMASFLLTEPGILNVFFNYVLIASIVTGYIVMFYSFD